MSFVYSIVSPHGAAPLNSCGVRGYPVELWWSREKSEHLGVQKGIIRQEWKSKMPQLYWNELEGTGEEFGRIRKTDWHETVPWGRLLEPRTGRLCGEDSQWRRGGGIWVDPKEKIKWPGWRSRGKAVGVDVKHCECSYFPTRLPTYQPLSPTLCPKPSAPIPDSPTP